MLAPLLFMALVLVLSAAIYLFVNRDWLTEEVAAHALHQKHLKEGQRLFQPSLRAEPTPGQIVRWVNDHTPLPRITLLKKSMQEWRPWKNHLGDNLSSPPAATPLVADGTWPAVLDKRWSSKGDRSVRIAIYHKDATTIRVCQERVVYSLDRKNCMRRVLKREVIRPVEIKATCVDSTLLDGIWADAAEFLAPAPKPAPKVAASPAPVARATAAPAPSENVTPLTSPPTESDPAAIDVYKGVITKVGIEEVKRPGSTPYKTMVMHIKDADGAVDSIKGADIKTLVQDNALQPGDFVHVTYHGMASFSQGGKPMKKKLYKLVERRQAHAMSHTQH